MRRRLLIAVAGTALWLGWSGSGARAQVPAPNGQPPPPPRRGLFGRRHANPIAGSLTPIPGGIIGNKRTHVYHLAGDKGKMPAEKNRVFFRTEAEARAAGFHAARQRGASARPTTRGLRGMRRTVPPSPPGQPGSAAPPAAPASR